MADNIEYKDFNFEVKDIDDHTFEGYASTFGNRDFHDDVMEKGAFKKTIAERKDRVKVLWQHNPFLPIGKAVHLEEDSKGLYVKAKISQTDEGKRAMTLIKDQVIDELSIGFQSIKEDWDNKDSLRKIKEVKLFEFSPVTFAANDQATITGAKSVDGLIPYLRRVQGLADELKEGRVLSEQNENLIRKAIESLQEVLDIGRGNEPKHHKPDDEEAKEIMDLLDMKIKPVYSEMKHSDDDSLDNLGGMISDLKSVVGGSEE